MFNPCRSVLADRFGYLPPSWLGATYPAISIRRPVALDS